VISLTKMFVTYCMIKTAVITNHSSRLEDQAALAQTTKHQMTFRVTKFYPKVFTLRFDLSI